MGEEEIMSLDEEFIVLAIPADTVEVDITATIYTGGKLQRVSKKMDFSDVRDAMKEAESGYIPSDAVFSLTPVGQEKLEALVKKYLDKEAD